MEDERSILERFGEQVKDNFISIYRVTDRKASGRFEREIRVNVRDNGFDIFAPAYAEFFINGRPKTKSKQKSDVPLYERIRQWLIDKGIVGNEYAIANKIHKEGYVGTRDIPRNAIPPNLLNDISKSFYDLFTINITNDIKSTLIWPPK